MMRRPVTIVVPVYGDLSSLLVCVDSLATNVDFSTDNVLLVNDCGPDAAAIEQALLDRIDGRPGFRYERNERNLGFVGNCNRAVFELDDTGNDVLLLNSDTITTPGFVDELATVLHLSPSHGVVCPRSNNATIASLPFQLVSPSAPRTVERSQLVHDTLRASLPRFSVSPVSMGFCFLIRRELIDEFGLFDEIFAPGYGEENDFCLRVNTHGYTSLIAHHVIVFHAGSLSFIGSRRNELRRAHQIILDGRYPWYSEMVQAYLKVDRDPVDTFADALVPAGETRHVLIEFGAEELAGQTVTALMDALSTSAPPNLEFGVSAPRNARRELCERFPSLVERFIDDADPRIWDAVVFDPRAIDSERLEFLNAKAPRWIVSLDGLGSEHDWAERAADHGRAATLRDALAFADGAVSPVATGGRPHPSHGLSIARRLAPLPMTRYEPGDHAGIICAFLGFVHAPVDHSHLRTRWAVITALIMRKRATTPGSAPTRRLQETLNLRFPKVAAAARSLRRRLRGR